MKITGSIDIAAARDAAKAVIDAYFSRAFDPHKAEAHRRKREEAQGYKMFPAPLLQAEAAALGVTVAYLATEILEKSDAFAAAEIKRRKVVSAIRAAKTKAELDEIVKPYAPTF